MTISGKRSITLKGIIVETGTTGTPIPANIADDFQVEAQMSRQRP